jgi:hypothetical protein
VVFKGGIGGLCPFREGQRVGGMSFFFVEKKGVGLHYFQRRRKKASTIRAILGTFVS